MTQERAWDAEEDGSNSEQAKKYARKPYFKISKSINHWECRWIKRKYAKKTFAVLLEKFFFPIRDMRICSMLAFVHRVLSTVVYILSQTQIRTSNCMFHIFDNYLIEWREMKMSQTDLDFISPSLHFYALQFSLIRISCEDYIFAANKFHHWFQFWKCYLLQIIIDGMAKGFSLCQSHSSFYRRKLIRIENLWNFRRQTFSLVYRQDEW